MHPRTRQAWLALPLILAVGTGIAWAGSEGPPVALGLPLFALCGLGSFVVNWIVFTHAYATQTERFFDITGSLTYLTLLCVALTLGPRDPRALLIGTLVGLWALRLGPFLFKRIQEDGGDGRFDRLKPDFARFLMTWTLQGLWVFLTFACGLVAMTTSEPVALGAGQSARSSRPAPATWKWCRCFHRPCRQHGRGRCGRWIRCGVSVTLELCGPDCPQQRPGGPRSDVTPSAWPGTAPIAFPEGGDRSDSRRSDERHTVESAKCECQPQRTAEG